MVKPCCALAILDPPQRFMHCISVIASSIALRAQSPSCPESTRPKAPLNFETTLCSTSVNNAVPSILSRHHPSVHIDHDILLCIYAVIPRRVHRISTLTLSLVDPLHILQILLGQRQSVVGILDLVREQVRPKRLLE